MTGKAGANAFLGSLDSFLKQARRLQGQGGERLAHDHMVAALGVAMSVARQSGEAALTRGASITDAITAAVTALEEIQDTLK